MLPPPEPLIIRELPAIARPGGRKTSGDPGGAGRPDRQTRCGDRPHRRDVGARARSWRSESEPRSEAMRRGSDLQGGTRRAGRFALMTMNEPAPGDRPENRTGEHIAREMSARIGALSGALPGRPGLPARERDGCSRRVDAPIARRRRSTRCALLSVPPGSLAMTQAGSIQSGALAVRSARTNRNHLVTDLT